MGETQAAAAAMAFDALSRSINSAVTERTSDSNGEQCVEESTTIGYGGFYKNAGSRKSEKKEPSVANSCSNSSSQSSTRIHEHDYIGLADSSSVSVDKPEDRKGSSAMVADVPDLNLGLRLGPPKNKESLLEQVGVESKAVFQETGARGSKRGFSETVEAADLAKGMSSKLLPAMFPWSNSNKPWRPSEQQRSPFTPFQRKDNTARPLSCTEASSVEQFPCLNQGEETPSSSGPMVGWPPVQSFRKNTLVAPPQNAKPSSERDAVAPSEQANGHGNSLFVKVYMDGVPIGRKVDLDANNSYLKLSAALKEMFSGFINGQNVSKQKPNVSSGEVQNIFDGYEAEYVLTYEDKDGDLMLVGDVPWRMFAATVKRLRIMKGTDAIGLGGPKDSEDRNRTKPAS